MVKIRAVVGAGVLAGILVAALLSTTGRILDLDLPPWSWSSMATGYVADAFEWSWSTIALMPFAIVLAIMNAFACAAVFEFVIGRAAPVAGALVGIAFATLCVAGLSLIPTAAFSLSYAYMPSRAPLGPYDASWMLAAVLSVGALAGLVAGLLYGAPMHDTREPKPSAWRELHPLSSKEH